MARTTSRQQPKKSSGYVRERVRGETVEPDYVLRLMSHVGPKVAAELIGVTTGTLHKGRVGNAVSPAVENAARGAWIERGFVEGEPPEEARRKAGTTTVARTSPISRPIPAASAPRTTNMHQVVASPRNEGTVLYLIQVEKERAAILERTAEALGATIISQA